MTKKDDMVTVQEAANQRGVSRSRIHQWISEGRLNKEERYGRTVVSLSEVMLVEGLKRGPKPRDEQPNNTSKKTVRSSKPLTPHRR